MLLQRCFGANLNGFCPKSINQACLIRRPPFEQHRHPAIGLCSNVAAGQRDLLLLLRPAALGWMLWVKYTLLPINKQAACRTNKIHPQQYPPIAGTVPHWKLYDQPGLSDSQVSPDSPSFLGQRRPKP